MELVNRILKFIPHDCMVELNAICKDRTIPDNNTKADLMRETLTSYDVDFKELGPGTNRYAIRIDGVVFKIAMDQYGVDDNKNEFVMSDQLQPFAAKTLSMDSTGLIITSEYVTVITKAEFAENEATIKAILAQLAERYLFGDVGFTLKNFVNWGYRENGDLVILDYGYIYRVIGDEVRCTNMLSDDVACGEFLEYDAKFSDLVCPKCRKKYTYDDIRRRVDKKFEAAQVQREIEKAHLITTVTATFDDVTNERIDDDDFDDENICGKENSDMSVLTEDERRDAFEYAVEHAAEIAARGHGHVTPIIDDESSYDCDEYDDTDDDTTSDTSDEECEWLDEEFDVISVCGQIAIFTNGRICDDDYIPDGYYKYHFRETDDYDHFGEIAKNVFTNHAGSFIINGEISEELLPMEIDEDMYGFSPDEVAVSSMTLREYMKSFTPDDGGIDISILRTFLEDCVVDDVDPCRDDDEDAEDDFDEDPDDIVVRTEWDDNDGSECDTDTEETSVEVIDMTDGDDDSDCDEDADTDDVEVEVIDMTDDEDDETPDCESDDDLDEEDTEVIDMTEDEDEEDDATISDIIEEIEEEEIENIVPPVDIPDECSDDMDADELLKQLEDRLVDTTDEVLSVEQNNDCGDVDVKTVRTIWSDPEPDDTDDMRKELARYAEEDEEEEDRRRSNHYKHNKRNKHR